MTESTSFSALAPPVFEGENYQVWAIKMESYLEANDLWEAVEEDYDIPNLPTNPTIAQMKQHKENKQRKSKAKACLFAAVSSSVFTRIMTLKSAKAIWDFLKQEYEGNEKIKGMQVMNLVREFEIQRMKESESIKEYSEKLLSIANRVRLLGQEFTDSRIVQKILVTLPERFEATISSLENTKDLSAITLVELLSALQAQEQRRAMRLEGTVEGALQAKLQNNQKFRMKKKGWQRSNLSHAAKKEEDSDNMTNSQCQHCGKKGHASFKCWKRPDRRCNKCNQLGHIAKICKAKEQHKKQTEAQIADQEEEQLFVASCQVTKEVSLSWLIDSGCTHHMTNNCGFFKELDKNYVSKVKIGNGKFIEAKGRGLIEVETNAGTRIISDVLYVPEINQNLISVSQLLEKGYKVVFEDKKCLISFENVEQFKIPMKGKSFVLDLLDLQQANTANVSSTTELWHRRLGHYNQAAILSMKKLNLVEGMPALEDHSISCKTCQFGKQSRQPFPHSAWRASRKLQLVHTDLGGPLPEPSLNGSRYYILFIDDFTRMSWIYFLKFKTEVADIFWKFKNWIENQCSSRIQMLRSDNGGEYTSGKFNEFCAEAGITHQLTAPYSPQQNGVSERKNRTIMEMTRCLIHEKGLPKNFWAEAASTTVYLLNRLPTKATEGRTPFELWYEYKPSLSHLKVFGCVCFTYVPQARRDKLDKKAEAGIFIGYSNVSKAYRVYQPQTGKILVSRDVHFEEEQAWKWEESQHRFAVKQIEVQDDISRNEDVDEQPVRGTRTLSSLYERCSVAMSEPTCFKEAQEDVNWVNAMNEELTMIEKNETWELVPRPQHKRVIGVKWVFRTKLNADGSINKRKARLVVKGYAQISGIDFSETFAPVARLDTIRMLLALAAHKGWKVFQLDVKSAFLNGVLEEEIYVEQPDGFPQKEHEDDVYLLKKALYGLKQAPRAWYSIIDQHFFNLGFIKSLSESTLYVKQSGAEILVVSLYVDDLLITGSNIELINHFKAEMMTVFEMTDLGEMTYFLGMEIKQHEQGIFICQQKYAKEILKRFHMDNCKSMSTPMNLKEKLSKKDGPDKVEETAYRSLIGSLMYLTATRPDILFAVSLLSKFLHCANEEHFKAAKRVLRYIKGTISFGVMFKINENFNLHGYSDSDWAGSTDDMRSTTGYCFSFRSGMFSWSSKRQKTVAQSTAEAEFVAATAAANQALWLRKLLEDLKIQQRDATKINVDNQAAIAISNNPVFHGKTKHFNIKLYFLREVQNEGKVSLQYCRTEDQLADIFTKALPKGKFEYLRKKLGVCSH